MVTRLPGLRAGLICSIDIDDPVFGSEAYRSRVEEIEDDRIVVQWPSKKGQLLTLAIGDPLSLAIPTMDALGRVDATLYLDCEVAQRIAPNADNPSPLIGVRVVSVGRQQQRSSFRLALQLSPIDCAVWERDFGQTEAEGTWKPINAQITDISAGGMGLRADQEVLEGSRMRLRFPYPTGVGECATDARVQAAQPLITGETTRYRLGLAFDNMMPAKRERVQRSIHRYQVEQRRRERGRVTAG